jgi:hypothetical protein
MKPLFHAFASTAVHLAPSRLHVWPLAIRLLMLLTTAWTLDQASAIISLQAIRGTEKREGESKFHVQCGPHHHLVHSNILALTSVRVLHGSASTLYMFMQAPENLTSTLHTPLLGPRRRSGRMTNMRKATKKVRWTGRLAASRSIRTGCVMPWKFASSPAHMSDSTRMALIQHESQSCRSSIGPHSPSAELFLILFVF